MNQILTERKTFAEKDGSYEHATLSKEGIYGKTARYDRDFLVSTENKKYKITHFDDLCYNPANLKFGVICLNKYGDAIISPIYVTFEVNHSYDNDFIGTNLSRWDFINYALRFQQGTVYERMAVSPEDFLSIKRFMPSYQEQCHISQFTKLLDKRIEKHSAYVEALKKYKRGVIKQLLSPERSTLANVTWTTNKIGKIGTFIKGAPLSKADISEDGTPFILYGELYTTYNEVATDIVRKTKAEVDPVYFSQLGDVVIPTSGETPEEISTATCVMVSDVILAGDLNIFRTDAVDGRILSYILNHIVNGEIARIAQGKSVVHIQASEIAKIEISYPDTRTQEKMTAVFEAISAKITSAEKILHQLQEEKRSLLQQLFI